MTTKTDITLPEPAFKLRWHDDAARYTVSVPNIGDTDCYTADQVRAAVEADRQQRGELKIGDRRNVGGVEWVCTDPDIDRWICTDQQRGKPVTDTFVQIVPDKCDRIVWRNNYYHLPIKQPAAPVNHPEDGLAMVKPVIPSNSGELKPAASAEPVVSDINDLIERVLDAQQDLNLEANMQMSQTLCSVSAMLDDVEDALRRFAALAQQPSAKPQREPDGYAYRYPSDGGTFIRFNGGCEVNGSMPIETVPFWYEPPDVAQALEDAERYRWATALDDNSETLHSIVLSYGGDQAKINERVDVYRACDARAAKGE